MALCGALLAFAARAQDRFEVQVYDSEVARAGEAGVELHVNSALRGTRAVSPDGELPTSRVVHLTLEPHLGVFGWGELGAYLQGALRPEGAFDFAGVKLRFKAAWPEKFLGGRVGLAVNGELSRVPAAYEANVWGSELRPVADLRVGPWYASINPIVGVDLQGPLAGHPQLQPAAKVAWFAAPALSIGAESYSALGPLDALLPPRSQSHQVYGVLDLAAELFDLEVGVGRGLGTADPWVAKAIVGVHARQPEPAAAR